MGYVSVSFSSLPSVIRDLIEAKNEIGLVEELKKLKYSAATKKAAKHYFCARSIKSS